MPLPASRPAPPDSRRRPPFAAALACLVLAAAAAAPAPNVLIDDCWFATMPNGGPTYGYFRISNRGGDALLITGYSSPGCGDLKLEEAHSGGTNGHAPVQMTVAGKTRLVFSRGGYHLVCERPTGAVAVGRTVPVTLAFQNGAHVEISFPVRPPPPRQK